MQPIFNFKKSQNKNQNTGLANPASHSDEHLDDHDQSLDNKSHSNLGRSNLGRLKSLGIKEPVQSLFFLPRKYHDIRKENIHVDFKLLFSHLDEKVFIGCMLHGAPMVEPPKEAGKPPMIKFSVKDKQNNVLRLVMFGSSREILPLLQPNQLLFFRGTVGLWNEHLKIGNLEWIDPKWVGRIRPAYPGKSSSVKPGSKTNRKSGGIKPETVREHIILLANEHCDTAIQQLRKTFFLLSEQEEMELLSELEWKGNLYSLLKNIHSPKTIELGEHAQQVIKRLAALEVIQNLDATQSIVCPESKLDISKDLVSQVISEMPSYLKLTGDQKKAIDEAVNDLNTNKPMNRLLTGDVGTGKSFPIAVLAAIVARLNENVVILMPNEPLAEQMRKDIESWWPDTQPKLVTGSTKNKSIPDSRILVGTTALNFRLPVGHPKLLMIDEQQKTSVEQRLSLAGPHTNVLEASATPLPRSVALLKYGGIPMSILREAYVKKNIRTELVCNTPDEKRQLFQAIKQCVADGYQALIVFPLAETAEIKEEGDVVLNQEQDLKSAEGAFSAWENHFPGRVRFVHGKMPAADKMDAIDAMKNNLADILCATTVVEVGLNMPNLRHVMVIHPERLGLSTLHQIRGRLCRHGGDGMFTLYLPDDISEKSQNRMDIMLSTNDGFKIALEDMRLRGVGDMVGNSENEQSGDVDMSFLVNQKITIDDFDWAVRYQSKASKNQSINHEIEGESELLLS